ncbi:hypothetical protein IE81DRAFT_92858 [Ceraceosorus guamensis]|uniref:Uncharacterized protein n=1 Tax=Ceraceosorus guamensis TaxID=1522189 RepID=A0A316W393_9BASI|nr:hypothetical protein IE81DRAFT_92858 [Ceraceosorus guamensis]PWN43243.1 hypothetical protein IE81DRAFT_92858 [Ceraceosorus guamensis]
MNGIKHVAPRLAIQLLLTSPQPTCRAAAFPPSYLSPTRHSSSPPLPAAFVTALLRSLFIRHSTTLRRSPAPRTTIHGIACLSPNSVLAFILRPAPKHSTL